MEVLLIFCGIIALFLIYPYIRIFIKRLVMCGKLKLLCRKYKFSLIPNHCFWFLGQNRGTNCDFYIETPDSVFAVKLFSVKHRVSELRFVLNGQYYIKRYIPLFYRISIPVESRKKSINDYNFRKSAKDEWYLKDIKNVLLINPICYEVFLKENFSTHDKIISSGDMVYGMTVYSFSGFRSALRYESER